MKRVTVRMLVDDGERPPYTIEFEADGFEMDESHHWPPVKKRETEHPPMCRIVAKIRLTGNVRRVFKGELTPP